MQQTIKLKQYMTNYNQIDAYDTCRIVYYFINYEKSYNEKYDVKSHQIKQITWFLHEIKEENHIFQTMLKMLETIQLMANDSRIECIYWFFKIFEHYDKENDILAQKNSLLTSCLIFLFCFRFVMSKKSFQTRFCC